VFRDYIPPGVLPLLILPIGIGLLSAGCTTDPLDIPCPALSAGDLVITEIHGPQSGEDRYGEWIEVFNASPAVVDLSGLSVSVIRLDGSSEERLLVRSTLSIASGAYAVFGKQLPGAEPDYVNYGYLSDLSATNKKLPDSGAIEVSSCGERIDLVVYRNLPSKGSVILDGSIDPPSAVANDDEINWCIDNTEDAMSETFGIRGTPQEANPICPE
jgi:hypothetical protein